MPPLPGQEEPIHRMEKIVNAFLTHAESGPFREPVDWRGLELHDYPQIIKHMMDLGTIKRKLDRGQYSTAHQVANDIRLVWRNCMTYNAENSDFWVLAKTFSRRFEDRYRKITRDFDVGEDLIEESTITTGGKGGDKSPADADGDTNQDGGDDDDEEDEDDDEDDEEDAHDDGEFDDADSRRESVTSSRYSTSQQYPTLDERANFAANLLLLNGKELGHIVSTVELKCPAAIECNQFIPEKMELIVDNMDKETFAELSKYAASIAATKKRPAYPTIAAINDISNKRKRKR